MSIRLHNDRDNLFLYTYCEISAKIGISYKTVANTMKLLLNADFMRRHSSGHYAINPGIIFKGAYTRHCAALDAYLKLPAGETASQDELRLSDVQESISRLKRQEMYLKSSIENARGRSGD